MPTERPRGGRANRRSLRSPCPIAGALDLVGDRWTLLVIRDLLLYDKRRFADFQNSPEGIASNILADRLDRLEQCGLIARQRYADRPPRVEYHPTPRAWELAPVLRELIRWGQRHVPGTAKHPPAGVSERGRRLMHSGPSRQAGSGPTHEEESVVQRRATLWAKLP
jgi:DNA-binding HxlR family transcriptional regulator